MTTLIKTYANRAGAKRSATNLKINLATIEFIENADGRWTWNKRKAKKATIAKQAIAKPVVAVKKDTGEIPTPTIEGQGALDTRKRSGKVLTTKAGQVRAIITSTFDLKTRNVEECIGLIQTKMKFTRNLARIYFANNLPKVHPQFILDILVKA